MSELRSFLGLAGYYRKFIKNFARINAPLYNLTRKDVAYVFKQEHKDAFNLLKRLLISAPILSHPDYNLEFFVQTDACEKGLGAVLTKLVDGKEKVI